MKKLLCYTIFLVFSFYAHAVLGWSNEVKATAADAAANDNFGYAVSVSGDYAIIGSYKDDDGGSSSGSAYIFMRDGDSWSQQTKLTASDAAANDSFGYAVSISGNYAIVGAYQNDDGGSNSGSAYIFVRDGDSWSQQTKLTASDAATNDSFGYAVSISGNYAIVGAYQNDDGGSNSGSAYMFVRDGDSWSQQAKIIASDDAASDFFGYAVSISGDYAVVGAYQDDDGGSSSGSAYIFVRDGVSWSQQAKLVASDDAANDYFGYSVSISGAYAIIGSYRDDDGGSSSGSAYIFVRDGVSWSQQAKLTASDPAINDFFGYTVSITDGYAAIGAYYDDDGGINSGSAYIFVRSGILWSQQAKLIASDDAANDYFGYSVSIDGYNTIIGAYQDDDGSSNSGSAYLYTNNHSPVADAGANQDGIREGGVITLNGTCSDADEGDILTGVWTQTSGTSCGEISGTPDETDGGGMLVAEATCIAPDIPGNENLVFQLACSDGIVTITDTVEIGVNAKPTANPQALSTDEDTSLAITLTGSDPNDEDLTYSITTPPFHGEILTDLPFLTYNPEENYSGDDSLIFRVTDEAGQGSEPATVSISISSENDPPIIHESPEGLRTICPVSGYCPLPNWSIEDPDGDEITQEWQELHQTILHFTPTHEIDLTNYHPPRNTYYLQLVARDSLSESRSSTVEATIPNHKPFLENEILVEDTPSEDGRFVLNSFQNIIEIDAVFTDYDNDNLSYLWQIIRGSAGFEETNKGVVNLHVRKAGTSLIRVTVDDGFGETSSEEINIIQPLPSFEPSVLITSVEITSPLTQNVSGQISSPLEPIVIVNGITSVVNLSTNLKKDLNLDLFETYLFKATDVPTGSDPSVINISVLTDVDGEQVSLSAQSVIVSEVEDGDDGDNSGDNTNTGDNPGDTEPTSAFYSLQGGGCEIIRGDSKSYISWFIITTILLIIILSRESSRLKHPGKAKI